MRLIYFSIVYKMVTSTQSSNKLLTAKELRQALNISPNTLQRLRKENKIPYIKIGGNFRYDLTKIIQLTEKGGLQ